MIKRIKLDMSRGDIYYSKDNEVRRLLNVYNTQSNAGDRGELLATTQNPYSIVLHMCAR